MFVQDNLQHPKALVGTRFPNPKFFLMSCALVIVSLLFFAASGLIMNTPAK